MRMKFMRRISNCGWLASVVGVALLLLAGCAHSPSNDTSQKPKPTNFQEALPVYNDPKMGEPLPIYDRNMQDKPTPPPQPSTNVGG
jgi:type IV pilus biogenesis protein CpaD/CtpE